MAQVTGRGHVGICVRDGFWNQVRRVPVGGTMTDEPATLEIAR